LQKQPAIDRGQSSPPTPQYVSHIQQHIARNIAHVLEFLWKKSYLVLC